MLHRGHSVRGKCCLSSRRSSEEKTPFLGKAVGVDFLEEVGFEEVLKSGRSFDSLSTCEGRGT